MTFRALRRARRTARAVLHGPEILKFISSAQVRERLVAAAEAGHPPVSAISKGLEKLIGLADAKLTPVKQFAGLCIRAVLEEEGYEVAEAGVRLSRDPVFRTGAVYRKAVGSPTPDHNLLRRFIASLTDEEAAFALELLIAPGTDAKRHPVSKVD